MMTVLPGISALKSYLPKEALAQKKLDDAWKTEKIHEAAEDFESQFLSLMIENMFTGINSDGMFGAGHTETVYRGFMADEYAKSITEQGGIGLADAVRQQLLGLQEAQDTGSVGGDDA